MTAVTDLFSYCGLVPNSVLNFFFFFLLKLEVLFHI